MEKWEVLGIEPTEDISVIKKAYAKKLKICRPDEDPQGFQSLREAYEAALLHTQRVQTKHPTISDHSTDSEGQEYQLKHDKRIVNNSISEELNYSSSSLEEENEKFMENVQTLYDNFFMRIDFENWNSILSCDAMWDIRNRENLSYRMLEFLIRHPYLPQDVWRLLDSNFNWSEQEHLYYEFDETFILYIFKQIKQTRSLNYCYIKSVEGFDIEEYLKSRDIAFTALARNDLNTAYSYLEKAKRLYPSDLDILHLEGDYLIQKGRLNEALLLIEQLLKQNPNDVNGIFLRGKISFEKREFYKAIDDYTKIKNIAVEDSNLCLLIAKCYLQLDDFKSAKDYLHMTLEIMRDNVEAREYLLKVNVKLKNRLIRQILLNPQQLYLRHKLKQIKDEIKQQRKFFPNGTDREIKFNRILRIAFVPIILSIYILGIYFLTKMDTDTESLSNLETIEVSTIGELQAIDPDTQKARLKASNTTSLDLYCTWNKDMSGEPEIRYYQKMDAVNGFVHTGVFDNELIILVSRNYINLSDSTICIVGSIKELNSHEGINNVKEYLEEHSILTDYKGKINQDMLILIDYDSYSIVE
jgi:tetratricopeptide (TPR) repeat protein